MRRIPLAAIGCLAIIPGVTAFGQQNIGCGPAEIKFESHLADIQASPGPVPGKALVYFDENDAGDVSAAPPLTRVGIDGQWVGAMQEVSWIYAYVEPRSHQLCANWQTSWQTAWPTTTRSLLFTAQPGGVYYFEVKYEKVAGEVEMHLKMLDSDQGPKTIRKYFYGTSRLKK